MTAQQMVRGPRVHRATSLSVCHHHHSEVSTSTTTFRQLHVIMLFQHLWTPHVCPLCSIYYYYCCQVFPLLFTLQFYTLLVHDFTFLSLLYHSVAVLSSLFPLGVLFMLILLWSRLHPFYKPYPSAASHFFPEKNDVEKIFVN